MSSSTITRVVASGLVWHERQILLLCRAQNFQGLSEGEGYWEPPGGKIEPGETIEGALAREVREETGLSISQPTLADACCYVLEGPDLLAHRFHLFYRIGVHGAPGVRLSDEHRDHRWLDSTVALGSLRMLPALRSVVEAELAR